MGQFFCRAADVIDAVCGDVSAGLDCRFTDGGKCRYADLDAGASGRRFDYGIYPVEGIGVFRVPKNGDARNKNHLLCGWRQSVVQKNHLSVTIELFRHYCKKGKVILWRIRIMI